MTAGPSQRVVAAVVAVLAVALGCGAESASVAAGDHLQGAGHRSPREGETVASLEVVVTAVDGRRRSEGFWVWLGDDGDPATSDGLRVAAEGSGLPEPGDRLEVSGRVAEVVAREGELPVTTLFGAEWRIVGRGSPPPPRRIDGEAAPPTVDDDGLQIYEPATDAIDFFESLEGMPVALAGPRVVAPTNRFGEVVVVPAGFVVPPGRATAAAGLLAADDPLGGLWMVDPGPFHMPRVSVGGRFEGPLVGVVDYGYGTFRLVLTEPPASVVGGDASPPTAAAASDGRSWVSVATWNVLNLGGDDDDEAFARRGRAIVEDLGAPDLVAVQEIQDASGAVDDGVVDADPVLHRLVAAIAAAGGPRYRSLQIDPADNADGGAPGANIRVALLYRPERVRVAGAERLGGASPAFEGSRKPLVAELRIADRTVWIVNNHWLSKLGDDPVFGSRQPPSRQSEARRAAQAVEVAAWVRGVLEDDAAARIVVLGDLNEHEFRPPLLVLEQAGLENLILRVPAAGRYTYNFRGQSQVLDHILVSPSLAAGAEAWVVHRNADRPEGRRASDHDAVVARLRLDRR